MRAPPRVRAPRPAQSTRFEGRTMYADRTRTTIHDHREMLRVKVKSLAAEARIIRREEMRTSGPLREALYLHRTHAVRAAAREAGIAYGYIRGRTLLQMEPNAKQPGWRALGDM